MVEKTFLQYCLESSTHLASTWISGVARGPDKITLKKKKALLIGINGATLKGPQEDVRRMRDLLMNTYNYNSDDITTMTDSAETDEHMKPTHDNMIRELERLTSDQNPGDEYFLLYAGHSGQRDTDDAGEEDRKDEYIASLDALGPDDEIEENNDKVILDDTLKALLVDTLMPGSKLFAVFDSCHSATLLDLHHHRCNRRSLRRRMLRGALECMNGTFGLKVPGMMFSKFCNGFCLRTNEPIHEPIPVLCISACKDSQGSIESNTGESMTRALITLLEKEPHPTLKHMMRHLEASLHRIHKQAYEQYSEQTGGHDMDHIISSKPQDPQISSLKPLNMRSVLSL